MSETRSSGTSANFGALCVASAALEHPQVRRMESEAGGAAAQIGVIVSSAFRDLEGGEGHKAE